MLVKVNKISSLRVLKIAFHSCNFGIASFFISIVAMILVKPQLAINGTYIRVGQLVSQTIANNKVILDTWSSLIIVLYTFGLLFLIASSIIYYFIHFDYGFNNSKQTKISIILLVAFWLYFIFLSSILFTNVDKVLIDTTTNQLHWASITNFFKYKVTNGVTFFKFSELGIVFIVVSSIVMALVFVSWIIFSFKIINKKYI